MQTGGKGSRLAIMLQNGFPVLPGFVVTAEGYRRALASNGLRQRIAAEFSRKPLTDMRWEELWDASLRIRNAFLRTRLPQDLQDEIANAAKAMAGTGPFVVRSSALHEDSATGSCAGLHESFLNIHANELLEHIHLVWASLWSSSALSYARELGLQVGSSAMAVVIQPFLPGAVSGIAFAQAPDRPEAAMVEAVPGINQGLVDGEVAPDRWYITPGQGAILAFQPGNRDQICLPEASGGIRLVQTTGEAHPELLDQNDLKTLSSLLMRLSTQFAAPQDIEWTKSEAGITLLQSRPITGAIVETGTRRAFDLTLRRSFAQLQTLRTTILDQHLPAMARDAESLAKTTPTDLSDADLGRFLRDGAHRVAEWEQVYWRDFIPFVHGARLFGEVYNLRCKPADPHEFVRLLQPDSLQSVDRNRSLLELAHRRAALRSNPGTHASLEEEIGSWWSKWTEEAIDSPGREDFERLLDRLALLPLPAEDLTASASGTSADPADLTRVFLEQFPPDSREEARDLLELGRLSYRLRDDDNIHLAAIRRPLARAISEARRRVGLRSPDDPVPELLEDLISLLTGETPRNRPLAVAPLPGSGFIPPIHPICCRSSSGQPSSESTPLLPGIRLRQIRGQPANKGFARGIARVVRTQSDLFSLEKGEVLVVDSLSPEMTMVVPLAAAILERRGGMLIHGAIIAREYGIPCVTGLAGLLEAVETSDLLTVDGHFGLVTIERPEDRRTAGTLD